MVHEGPVIAVSFSHDDRYLATGSLDKTAKVWDFKENLELAPIIHDDEVTDVSFGSSGRHLATGSVDKTARVWELTLATEWDPEQVAEETAQQQIQEIVRIPHEDVVDSVHLGTNGKTLLTQSGNTAIVLSIVIEDLIGEACRRLPRNLTTQEWNQFFRSEAYSKTCLNLSDPSD